MGSTTKIITTVATIRRHIACRVLPGISSLSFEQLERFDPGPATVVSLDVFDTCLSRAVLAPADVFDLVPARAGIVWPNFRTARIRAEVAARQAAADGEPTLADIYAHLDTDVPELLQRSEIEAELAVLRARPQVRRFAARMASSGRRVVYLSDMYLPSATIADLLRHNGFDQPQVLVSCELGVDKRSGLAFTKLGEHLGVGPAEVFHLGDNLGADGIGARRAGVRAAIIEPLGRQLRHPLERKPIPAQLALGDSTALGVALQRAEDFSARSQHAAAIGATCLGPALLGFAYWLATSTSSAAKIGSPSEDDPVLFCSRDMATVMDVFGRITDVDKHNSPPRTHYLEVSRRSVGLPSLAGGFGQEACELMIGGRGLISERELWQRIGLEQLTPTGIDIDTPLAANSRDDVWGRMLAAHDEIVTVANRELRLLGEYWRTVGLPESGRAYLVDVGWRATVQARLEQCLQLAGIEVELHGRYLALLDDPPADVKHARGWLVHNGRPGTTRLAFEAGIPIVELALQAPEGTVLHYRNGIAVRGASNPDRIVQDQLQHGALAVVDRWLDLAVQSPPTAHSLVPLLRLLNSPRPLEARQLGAMPHTDRVGPSERLHPVLPSPPGRVWNTPTRIRDVEWRPGLIAATGTNPITRLLASLGLSALKRIGRTTACIRIALRRRHDR